MNSVKLIIIGGFAGAGKSTVSKRLAREYNYPVYSSDVINDALRPALNKSFHEVSPLAYDVMWHLVRKQLENGVTVIIDTHMCAERTWQTLDAIRNEMPDLTILPIILQCSLDTHRERIEHRGNTDSEHLNLGGDKLEDVLFKYEFIENLHRDDLIRIDANGTPDDVYSAVKATVTK